MRLIFSKHCIWEYPSNGKDIYLTFDDGPHPEITPWVLDLLREFDAKATFFCIGKNVEAYPNVYRRILEEGHRVGNHTHNHMNSKKVEAQVWLEDIKKASRFIDSDLFRPPYGQISRFRANVLAAANPAYRMIMWSVLSGDFDKNLDTNDCFTIVRKHSKPGGIIVFHDSEKAWPRLEKCLPETLKFLKKEGYIFRTIR